MTIGLFEFLAAAIYMLGYTVVSVLSFLHGDDHCWAYCMITLAAVIHAVILVVRYGLRQSKKAEPSEGNE